MSKPQPESKQKESTYVMDERFTTLTITDKFDRKVVITNEGTVTFTGSDKEQKVFEAGSRDAQIVIGGMHALLTHTGRRVKRQIFTEPFMNPRPAKSKFTLWPMMEP